MSIYEYINSGINPFLINGQTQLIAGKKFSINDSIIKSNEFNSQENLYPNMQTSSI